MKYKRLTALVLAAAVVLTGCGGTISSSGSAATSQSTGSSQNAPALAIQKERITEQFTLEKTIRQYEWDSAQKLTIHVPQLVCDSPDAESINDELAARYAAEYRDYESYPQAEVSQDEWCPQIYIDWDAYWYGDCVSLVVSSYYGGTDPIYTQGWCFDFATGKQVFVAEMLQRMGLDPDETQLAVYRAAIQTFDRNMVQQEYYDFLRESGMLSGMRADTLRDNGLENLTVRLKNENTVTLVAGYHTTVGSGCTIDETIAIEAVIENGVDCGPRAYLRPGTHMLDGSKAGTHVEIKKSTIGEGSKVPHLSYIGDTTMGSGVNVGAGSITCNYDGVHKHKTVIGKDAFIGSDTMMVAPAQIGDGALVAAGSVITEPVPADALGLGRARQVNIEGWAADYRRRLHEDDEV